MAPSTRTSATAGCSAIHGKLRSQLRLRWLHPLPATGSSSSRSMLRAATAAASGLAMNVGPCISTPPSAEMPSRHARGGQRCRQGQVAAGQRLAETQDVGRHAGMLAGEQLAGAAEAGGDLVGDQQHVVAGDRARPQPRGTRPSKTTCRRRPARSARGSPRRCSSACAPSSASKLVDVARHQRLGRSGSAAGRRTGAAAARRVNSSCMPLTGSHTAIAPKVSP